MKKYTIEWIKPQSGGGVNDVYANSFADAEKKFKDYWGAQHIIIKIELE